MTEQPAEPITEQEWLQNEAAVVPAAMSEQEWLQNNPAVLYAPLPEVPKQHYAPNAHRIAPPKLAPPTNLRPAPVVSMSRPYEVAQANILLRKAITAAAKLQHARAAAKKAEDAMSEALAVENLAEIDSVEADRTLLDFVREAADQ